MQNDVDRERDSGIGPVLQSWGRALLFRPDLTEMHITHGTWL